MQGLDIAYLCKKFQSLHLNLNGSTDHDPFRDCALSMDKHLLRSTYLSNLKSLTLPTMKDEDMNGDTKYRKWAICSS